MSAPLLTLEGMLSGHDALVVEDLLEHAVTDSAGRLLVSMIDALAIVHLDSDADLLLVEFDDGSSRAFRVTEVLEHDDLFIQLPLEGGRGAGHDGSCARLWSAHGGRSAAVRSIRATSFAAFVGSQ